ncbi:hypothetical protein GLAREA_11886 [Glarea lozoyensis ATCC 20868]|uniref:Uncharacterized protein n=1 Tax=Glarea lozoyensis (strain ATCC 20868 / MF5171) TaxID=1116229 RepID=S3D3W9_GLAL2|nr:uncharacterized protein GLAREA_11886 [Glarea lozoyensis ATCC 20868]EPE31804.1 hypothetical protein GLAREA_11886 [Glarea lozoyensis ATCC 20868]
MTDRTENPANNSIPSTTRPSSIPVRSIYLQPARLLHTPLTTTKPSLKYSLVKSKWKIDKLPSPNRQVGPPLESDPHLQAEPPWTRLSTEEPLSPELRAEVRQELIHSHLMGDMNEYRRQMKYSWCTPDCYMEIQSENTQFESRLLLGMCNKVVPFYWMPQLETNGHALPLLPFRCLFGGWFKFYDDEPSIEFGNFFADLLRVLPTGPLTIPGIISTHKRLYDPASSLLNTIKLHPPTSDQGEPWGPWKHPEKYQLKQTYRAIIMMMDRYVSSDFDLRIPEKSFIDVAEHARKQTVLLVRTGEDEGISSLVDFETLRASGKCLPLDRNDVEVDSEDVVRVSIADAVEFVCGLEDPSSIERGISVDRQRKAEAAADGLMREADEKGIDGGYLTWRAVRCVKARRMGEEFREEGLWEFNRVWR